MMKFWYGIEVIGGYYLVGGMGPKNIDDYFKSWTFGTRI
jgi:hypothetical protein